MVFSLVHWLKQATSPLGQLRIHSTKLISQRSVHARFKSGTLKIIFNRGKIATNWLMLQIVKIIQTYTHSA